MLREGGSCNLKKTKSEKKEEKRNKEKVETDRQTDRQALWTNKTLACTY